MNDDPRPQAPREPPLEACCGNGCTPCVFDRYADALALYEVALKGWEARQAARHKTSHTAGSTAGSEADVKAAGSGQRRSHPRPGRA
jgi:hypothetical protein